MRTSLWDDFILLKLLEQGIFCKFDDFTGNFGPCIKTGRQKTATLQTLGNFPVYCRNRAFKSDMRLLSRAEQGTVVAKTGDIAGLW
jgi:hypothetical protein